MSGPSQASATARRVFVVAWMLVGVVGALNDSGADLLLPHLRYAHVMFIQNPRTVRVFHYALANGQRGDLADLVQTPAPGYKRTRVGVNLASEPMYLAEICYRAARRLHESFAIHGDEYQVDRDPAHPARSFDARCGMNGLSAR